MGSNSDPLWRFVFLQNSLRELDLNEKRYPMFTIAQGLHSQTYLPLVEVVSVVSPFHTGLAWERGDASTDGGASYSLEGGHVIHIIKQYHQLSTVMKYPNTHGFSESVTLRSPTLKV